MKVHISLLPTCQLRTHKLFFMLQAHWSGERSQKTSDAVFWTISPELLGTDLDFCFINLPSVLFLFFLLIKFYLMQFCFCSHAGISYIAPHLNNLYFLTLCQRYGVYQVIRWLFMLKLGLSVAMLLAGADHIYLLCIFIARYGHAHTHQQHTHQGSDVWQLVLLVACFLFHHDFSELIIQTHSNSYRSVPSVHTDTSRLTQHVVSKYCVHFYLLQDLFSPGKM